jgi:hypothetical protein
LIAHDAADAEPAQLSKGFKSRRNDSAFTDLNAGFPNLADLCPGGAIDVHLSLATWMSSDVRPRCSGGADLLDRRRETVEHPFGSIKQWMNQGAFLMRGLERVRGEFSLTALAYNLRRVLNIVELPKLIAALTA